MKNAKVKRIARARSWITGESYMTARMRVVECAGKYLPSEHQDPKLRDVDDAEATIVWSPPRRGQ